jgi:hypothetical protein
MYLRKRKLKNAKNRKALYDYMTPGFWHAHFLFPTAIILFALGIALGIAHNSTLQPIKTLATSADNIIGWSWTPTVGWFSLNDTNAGSCGTPPCGSYGIHLAVSTSTQPDWDPSKPPGSTLDAHAINGFAWSDNVGFICFGNSCNIPSCTGSFYPDPPGNAFYAYAEPITGTSAVELHGWGVICNQKDGGWISLNCNDLGACDGSPGSTYYKLVYDPTTQVFHNAAAQGSPFAWNGNSDGSGIGYINFYASALGMQLNPDPENTVPLCTDGIDNNLNGSIDCADSDCWGTASCPEICTDTVDNDADTLIDCADPDCFGPTCPEVCADTQDNDGDGDVDCADSDCFGPGCNEVCTGGLDEDGDGLIDCNDPDCPACPEVCDDTIDNDGDTLIDCADPDCAADPSCAPPQHQCVDFNGNPDQANLCCNDQDPNGTAFIDCFDPDCRDNASVCSAWLQVSTGNIYAFQGIIGTTPSAQTGLSNTKWCLRSDQTIEWTSEESCKQEGVGEITLPSQATKYRNKLGFLDLAGMRINNRYARVWNIADASGIPATLNGAIYHFTGSGEFTLPAKTFLNGSGDQGDGSGLLLIDGADLRISGDIEYTTNQVQTRLQNLASFGVVVVKDSFGGGGNIIIDPGVTLVSGVYFAESDIYTGSVGIPPDAYLDLVGIFIANQFNLERDNNTDPTRPAERILFDGRAVVDPPPGLSDVSKSLPRSTEITF